MKKAVETDASNPEVYSTLASVRLSQCRDDDARTCLETSMDLWYTEQEEGKDVNADPNWPALGVRMTLAKMLVETQLFDRACKVLETCQSEDDEDPECWYVFGWCYLQMAEQAEDKEDKDALIQDAKECLGNIVEVSSCADFSWIVLLKRVVERLGYLSLKRS